MPARIEARIWNPGCVGRPRICLLARLPREVHMCRQAFLIVALILSSTGLLTAQYATTQPATAPATQPIEAPRVLLLPFGEITDGPSHAWIGRAIEQSLLADLSRVPGITPVVYLNTQNATKVMDPIEAIKAG